MQLTSIHLSVFPPFTLAPRSTGTGLSIAGILGIVSAVVAAFVLLVLGMVVCIKFHGPFRTFLPPSWPEIEATESLGNVWLNLCPIRKPGDRSYVNCLSFGILLYCSKFMYSCMCILLVNTIGGLSK